MVPLAVAVERALPGLRRRGYSVVDGAFGEEFCRRCLGELRGAQRRGLLSPNATHFVRRSGTVDVLRKHGISEVSSADPETWRQCRFQAIQDFADMSDSSDLLSALQGLAGRPGLAFTTVKAQANDGTGGCYPLHCDSEPGVDGKLLTGILYLNEDWAPSHGGQLVLHPFPSKPTSVEPIFGRLVLFFSTQMLHRVLPAWRPRFCLNLWMYSSAPQTVRAGAPFIGSRTCEADVVEEQAMTVLLHPKFRRHWAKLALANEWEESLRDAHPATPHLDKAITQHRTEVQKIGSSLGQFLGEIGLTHPDVPCAKDLPYFLAEKYLPLAERVHHHRQEGGVSSEWGDDSHG
eukprot:CAMPEP_0118996280 /NCGR_PEP_ID=MMETSP1173-20130426/59785_1 /TAXON_ID=1034831 /ORGANISM="Rhizochromulina marina cf, Strain CCMP1243" /LENGTH=346 /DNA_ID=CAMNT_0006947665 /DNA_START=245 /DNA_END=1281 /DNA_ORIENTATION=+